MSDIRADTENILDMLVAGGISFDLKVWTKCAEIKRSRGTTWLRGISGQFGFQFDADDDGLLSTDDRTRFFIKKVAVPQIARLLAKGYGVKVLPSPATKGPAMPATADDLEALLLFAARWVKATDRRAGITLTVTTNEAE